MQKIGTVRDYIDGKLADYKYVYTNTAWGYQRVSYVRWPETNPWLVCSEENAGFGSSYMVSYSSELFSDCNFCSNCLNQVRNKGDKCEDCKSYCRMDLIGPDIRPGEAGYDQLLNHND